MLFFQLIYIGSLGSWWHLNWGELARGSDWSGISGMVLNTNTWSPGAIDAIRFVPFQP